MPPVSAPDVLSYYVVHRRLVHRVMVNSIEASLRYKHNRERPHMVMTWCQIVVDLERMQTKGTSNCLVCVAKLGTTVG